jgi:hypothetical protein
MQQTGRQLLGRHILGGQVRVPSALAKVAAAAKLADPIAAGSKLQYWKGTIKRAYYPNQGGWYMPPGFGQPGFGGLPGFAQQNGPFGGFQGQGGFQQQQMNQPGGPGGVGGQGGQMGVMNDTFGLARGPLAVPAGIAGGALGVGTGGAVGEMAGGVLGNAVFGSEENELRKKKLDQARIPARQPAAWAIP